MATQRAIVTRRAAAAPLRCYVADEAVAAGQVVLDPAGQRVQVVATAEQLLRPAPPPEGRATPALTAGPGWAPVSEALDRVPPLPFLNSVVETPRGPARMLRLRARARTAILELASGERVELPLAELPSAAREVPPAGAPPC
ncbi:MAG: hypothetical protein HYU88_08975 [Chloroflexi bacterium]|nr:hypothetical protein [Chloroflexota bacterium]